jgi:ubiquinol-cytochrome c reductase cytochrome b subunit
VKRLYDWLEDRTGLPGIIIKLARHPVPEDTGWAYVFGSSTLVCFIVLVVTGIALATGYTPTTNDAYHSINWISRQATFGRELRGIHYFAASAMVILIGIHIARVFLTGSFKFPREATWLAGVVLLLLTLAMAFTGQLLRWDQTAVWSVFIAAEQAGRTPLVGSGLAHFVLGGDTVGGPTLSRFFAFHVFFMPALIFAFIGLHLFLVLRNGISEPPKSGRPVDPVTYRAWYKSLLERRGVPFWPDAAWRDVVFGVGIIAVLIVLAAVFGPPVLGKPPDPTDLRASPRPDWYFVWYFAALAELPPRLEDWVILGGPAVFVVMLVLLPFVASTGERSPLRRPWAIGVVLVIVIILSTLLVVGNTSPWSPDFAAQPLPTAVVNSSNSSVIAGAKLFNTAGCEYCHTVGGYGGSRGPNLTNIHDRLSNNNMIIRILNGGTNMPAFGSILKPNEVNDLIAFLDSRHGS